jgi:tRNA wybutosine-synthesizing protein 2
MRRAKVAVVPRRRAEHVRRELRRLRAIDTSVRIRTAGPDVLIPIRGAGFDATALGVRIETAELEPRPRPRDVLAALRAAFEANGVPQEVRPSRWERLGDVVLVRLPRGADPHASSIGRILGEVLRVRTVVQDVSGVHGPFRVPDVRHLWGGGTETVHTEGGLRFRLDVARVMFSSGNLPERTSLPPRISAGDVVADLFAGIGYFAIPIAVRSRAARVFACEANPVSFPYLLENIRLNRAGSVVPRFGDCRYVAPLGVADWVVMGHFDAARYVDVGLRCLRDEGTLLVHGLVPQEAFPERFAAHIEARVEASGARVVASRARTVKSYAPGIQHAVLEVRATAVPKELSRRALWVGAVDP